MRNRLTRLFLLFSVCVCIHPKVSAQDSDQVNCNRAWRIVILGSSTAAGTGATTFDSSWVGRFTQYVLRKNPANQIINYGISGLRTYQNLRPNGYVPPANRPVPSTAYNITQALSQDPDAIIINMPSNDASSNYTLAEQQANFEEALRLADSAGVPVWATTTQPRNNFTASQTQNLVDMRNWIISRFGNKAIDFWTNVANADGTISSAYNADGIHVNNAGHALFYSRVRGETILDSLCLRACLFNVNASITGPANACNHMGSGDSAVYVIGSTDAVSWQWSVSIPSQMGLSAVSNRDTVKIKYVTGFSSGTLSVAVTGCDGSTVTRTLAVSRIQPAMPASLFGPSNPCAFIDDIATYSTPIDPNAASYFWRVPTSATIISGQGTNEISVYYPVSVTLDTVSVKTVSACFSSTPRYLQIKTAVPGTPSSIVGPTDVCARIGGNALSDTIHYKTRRLANTTSYVWTVPSGVTIVSGQGDTCLIVQFASTYVSGSISVRGFAACGSSLRSASIAVYKRTSSIPVTILKSYTPALPAVTNVCEVSTETYMIRKTTYATAYNWVMKNGSQCTITRLNAPGVNDTAVSLSFTSAYTRDTLQVQSVTPCSVSGFRTLVLTRLLTPPTITSITPGSSNTTPCRGDTVTYSITCPAPTSSQSSVAVFRWTARPANTTIVFSNADSSVIRLVFSATFSGGTLTARSQSACGIQGSSKSITLAFSTPTPSSITSSTGLYNACPGNSITYTAVVPAPSSSQRAASVYRWTRPVQTFIQAASLDSATITLSFLSGFTGGSISVAGQTACGTLGTAKLQTLISTGCRTLTEKGSPDFTSKLIDFETVYPNPNRGIFNITIQATSKQNCRLQLYNSHGLLLKSYLIPSRTMGPTEFRIYEPGLVPGVYFLKSEESLQNRPYRFVVF